MADQIIEVRDDVSGYILEVKVAAGASDDDINSAISRAIQYELMPYRRKAQENPNVGFGTQNQIVEKAASAKGTKYKWSGNDMKYGIDCSGLTCQTYGSVGIKTPRTAAEQYQAFQSVPEGQMLKGDAVFFYGDRKSGKQLANGKYITHVGIYDGNGNIIHASTRKGQVVQEPLAKLKKNVAGYGRPRELHERYQKEMAIGGQPNTPYIDGLRNPLVESINKALADKPQSQAPATPYTPPPTFKDIAAKALLEKREGEALIKRQKEARIANQGIGPVERPEYVNALREKAKAMGLSSTGDKDLYIVNELDKLDSGELLNLWTGGDDIPEAFQGLNRNSREFALVKREAINRLSMNADPTQSGILGYLATLPAQWISELGTIADPQGVFTPQEKAGAIANVAVELATAGAATGAKKTIAAAKDITNKSFQKAFPKFSANIKDILAGKKVEGLDLTDVAKNAAQPPEARLARIQEILKFDESVPAAEVETPVKAFIDKTPDERLAGGRWERNTEAMIADLKRAVDNKELSNRLTKQANVMIRALKKSLVAGEPHPIIVEELTKGAPTKQVVAKKAGATGAVEETPLQNVGSTPTASTSVVGKGQVVDEPSPPKTTAKTAPTNEVERMVYVGEATQEAADMLAAAKRRFGVARVEDVNTNYLNLVYDTVAAKYGISADEFANKATNRVRSLETNNAADLLEEAAARGKGSLDEALRVANELTAQKRTAEYDALFKQLTDQGYTPEQAAAALEAEGIRKGATPKQGPEAPLQNVGSTPTASTSVAGKGQVAKGVQKEPWEMTLEEFKDSRPDLSGESNRVAFEHRRLVTEAARAGKPVPKNVLGQVPNAAPHLLTKAEFEQADMLGYNFDTQGRPHEFWVEKAQKEGLAIPDEVLADYPDLAAKSVKPNPDAPLMSATGKAPTEQAQMGKSPVVENEPAIFTQLKAAMERTKIDPKIQKAALIQLDTLIQTGKKAGKDLSQIVWKALDKIDKSGKLKHEYAQTFYSKLERVVEEKIPNRASAEQVRKTLEGAGVKPEEMEWTGMDELLQPGRAFSKQDLLDHIQENQVRVEEVMKGRVKPYTEWLAEQFPGERGSREFQELYRKYVASNANQVKGGSTKFGPGSGPGAPLPGGENYRELLLTLPGKRGDAFTESHWDEPNVLAHIRFDERVGPNGEKVLHVAEVQSDWHQKGRKQGYREASSAERDVLVKAQQDASAKLEAIRKDMLRRGEEGEVIKLPDSALDAAHKADADATFALQEYDRAQSAKIPNAPFKKTWHELALKRILRYAAENDFARVSWDTGITNAERYDLSKQVDSIKWYDPRGKVSDPVGVREVTIEMPNSNGISLAVDESGKVVTGTHSEFNGKSIDDVVGKEIAQKIMADESGNLSGDGLKVGGEGMKGFYDKILPDAANKIGKRFGAKVEAGTVKAGENTAPAHSINITPEMKASLLGEGQPLFSKNKGVMGAYTRVKRSIELVENKATLETFFHEMGHFTHEVLQDHPEYGKVIRQHYGDIMDSANTAGAERFANAFVNYIRKGEAPTSKLAEVFEAVAGFIRKLIGKKKLDEFPEEVRDIFDKIYSQELSPHAQRLLDEFEGVTRGLPANKNTSAARSAAGLTPDARLKSTTTKQIFDDADKLYKKYEEGGYEAPEVQSALDGWRKHRRPLDAKNEVLISRVLNDLETKSNTLADEISTLSKPEDAELRTLKGKEWEKIAAQIDETSRVLQESGSWLGRALGIRSQLKRVLNKDANLAASAHHPGVTKKVRDAYEASVKQAQDAEKALRDAIRKSINSYVDEGSDALDPLFQLDANEIDDLLRLPDPKPNSRGEIELHDYVDQAVFRSLKNGATDTKTIIDDVINELGGELGLDIDQVKRAIKESLVYFDSKARRGAELGDAVYAPRGGAPKSAGVESEAIKELRDNLNMIREELGYRKGEKLVAGRVSVGELRSELEILFKELNATHDLDKMRELRVKVGELRRKVVAGRVDANDFMARATDADIAKLKADFKRATDEAEAAIKHLTPQGWWDAVANHFNMAPLMSVGNRVMDALGYVYNVAEAAAVTPFQAIVNLANRASGGRIGWAGSLSTPPLQLRTKATKLGLNDAFREFVTTLSSKFGRPKLKKVYDQGFVYQNKPGLKAAEKLHNLGLAGVSLIDSGPSMMKYHQALMQVAWLKALEEVDTMALGARGQWVQDRAMRLYLDAPHELTEEAFRLVEDWRFSAPAFGGELTRRAGASGYLKFDLAAGAKRVHPSLEGPVRALGTLGNIATVRFANIFANLMKPGIRMAYPAFAWAEVTGKYLTHAGLNVHAGKGLKGITPTEVFKSMSPSQRRMFVNAVGRAGTVTVASTFLPQYLYHSLGARPVSYDADRKEWDWGLHGMWGDIPGVNGLTYKLNVIHNEELYKKGAYGKVGSPEAIEKREDAHASFAWKFMTNHPLASGASRAFRAFQSGEGAQSVAGSTLRRAIVPAVIDVSVMNKNESMDKYLTALLLKAPYRKSLNTGLGKYNRFTDELIGVYFKPGTYDTRHPLPWMDKPPAFSHPVIKELTRIGFRLDVQRATGESDEEFKMRRALVTEALWNDPEFGVQVLINDPKWKELDDIAKREKVIDFRSKLVRKMNAEVENAWQNKEFLRRYREKYGKEPPMAEERQNK